MDFVWFTLFSTIEGIAIYFLMLSIFRLNPGKHFSYFIPIVFVMVVQSFVLREELSFAYVSPIISALLFVFFLAVILKISLIWSFIITFVGYFAYGTLQYFILELLFSSVNEMKSDQTYGYILQSVTAAIALTIAFVLSKYRIGFIADFEKLRFAYEKYIVVGMIIVSLIGLALVSINVSAAMIIVVICFAFFLYFSIRKEREND